MNHTRPSTIYIIFGAALGFFIGVSAHAVSTSKQKPKPQFTAPIDYFAQSTFRFVRAIDGDTLDIADAQDNITRIRLHGIDTPERGKFYAAEATAQLHNLCKDKPIKLGTIGDGGYGRVSANLYCAHIFVNAALIESGAAITSIKYADDPSFYELQNRAQQSCKGVWANPINTSYSVKQLKGDSPIHGQITLITHRNCAVQSKH